MSDNKPREILEFDGLKVPIRREDTHELYIALQPPDAAPYVVAPRDKKPEEIVEFINYWMEVIRELRTDMIKRFSKSKSMKCHYQTGDVAYMFGRPFMLKVYPLGKSTQKVKGTRGRVNVTADIRPEISVIDIFVMQTKDYDQARMAFLAFAKPILVRNSINMVRFCRDRAFPGVELPGKVKCRPMRDTWVQIDQKTDTIWFSERLIPYPPDSNAYAFLVELIKLHAPDADEDERAEILDRVIPNWRQMKAILADNTGIFTRQ